MSRPPTYHSWKGPRGLAYQDQRQPETHNAVEESKTALNETRDNQFQKSAAGCATGFGLSPDCMAEHQRTVLACTRPINSDDLTHALCVGLKRFRYAVESLLPDRSITWDESLGQIQGLLSQIHDLDVLRSRMTQELDGINPASA